MYSKKNKANKVIVHTKLIKCKERPVPLVKWVKKNGGNLCLEKPKTLKS